MQRAVIFVLIVVSSVLLTLMNNCSQSGSTYKTEYSSSGRYKFRAEAPLCADVLDPNNRVQLNGDLPCNCRNLSASDLSKKEIFGYSTYSVTSDICKAAKQMNLVGESTVATVIIAPGRQCSYFQGITQNQITSLSLTLSGADDSFYFKGFGDGRCATAPGAGTDKLEPTLVSTFPAKEAKDVAVDSSIKMIFNEAVKVGTGNIKIYKSLDGSLAEDIDVTSASVRVNPVNDMELLIDPVKNLEGLVDYYILMDAGIVVDLAGNKFAGMSDPSNYFFKTSSIDQPPQLLSFEPTNGAKDIAVDSKIILNFSENISKGSGQIKIYKGSDSSLFETIDVGDVKVVISNSDVKQVSVTPSSPFSRSTNYFVIIDSGAFKDGANQDFAGLLDSSAFAFKTVSEDPPPSIITKVPADDANAVRPDTKFVFTFSEPVVKGSGMITLHRSSTNEKFAELDVLDSKVVISAGEQKEVTIDFAKGLEFETDYYIKMAAGTFKDNVGQDFAGIANKTEYNFKVAAAPDLAPTLVSTTPANASKDISQVGDLTLQFSEPVKKGQGSVTIYKASNALEFESIDISSSNVMISASEASMVTIKHTKRFAGSTQYFVKVSAGAFKDLKDQDFAGVLTSKIFSFTTAANEPAPQIASLLPADGATNVLVNANLVITFTKAMKKGSGNLSVYKSQGDVLFEQLDVGDQRISISSTNRKQVTIDLKNDFANTTDYYVKIDKGALVDDLDQPFAGIATSLDFNFKTAASVAPPTLVSFKPALAVSNVAVDVKLELTFSVDISKGKGKISIYNAANDSLYEEIDVASANVSIARKVATVSLVKNLLNETNFYLKIDKGAFVDSRGQAYAGIVNSTTFFFKTVASDPYPTLAGKFPDNGAVNVAVDADLNLTFSEPVVKGAGHIIIYKAANDTVFEDINVTAAKVTIATSDAKLVAIKPQAKFAYNTEYYVKIDAGAFKDKAKQNYAGIKNSADYKFKTLANPDPSPTLTSTTPVDNSIDVPLDGNLVFKFSEPVKKGSGKIAIFKATRDVLFSEIDASHAKVLISSDGLTVTVPHAAFAYETEYYVKIASGAFKDSAGQSFAGITNSTILNFKTIKQDLPPTVVSKLPADGDQKVPVNSKFTLTFSEPVKKGIGNIVFYHTSGNGEFKALDVNSAGIVIDSADNKKVTIDPGKVFAYDTKYYLKIAKGAFKDSANQDFEGLLTNANYNFKTVANLPMPKITSKKPLDGATNFPIGGTLELTFNSEMLKGKGTVKLLKTKGGNLVEASDVSSGNISINAKVVSIKFNNKLEYNTGYYVTIDSGAFIDKADQAFVGFSKATDYNFTTEKNVAPTITTKLPADNAQTVAVNSKFTFTFSEPVTKGDGTIVFYQTAGNILFASVDVKSANVVIDPSDSKKVTFDPGKVFAKKTGYYVKITKGALKDLAGLDYDGITTNAGYNFKTAP